MGKESVLCTKCNHLIDVTDLVDDYYDYEQEEAIAITECEKCKTKNTIYWQSRIEFWTREACKEEIKDLEYDLEGNLPF